MTPAYPIFIGSEVYRGSSYGASHPLRVPRVSTVMDLVRALGWLPARQFITSPRAKPKALELWHAPAYIEALQVAARDGVVDGATCKRFGLGTLSNRCSPTCFAGPPPGPVV